MGSLRYPWSRPSRIIPIGGDLTWLGFSGPQCLAEVQVMFRLKALDETASSMGVFKEVGVTQEPPGVAGWEAEWYIRVP